MIKNPFETPPAQERLLEGIESVREEQRLSVVPAKTVSGFADMDVAYTLEQKRRSESATTARRNEDAALADPSSGLLGVFDGVGSTAQGAEASAIAAHILPDLFLEEETRQRLRTKKEVLTDLRRSLIQQTERRAMLRPASAEGKTEINTLRAEESRMRDILDKHLDLAARALALLTSLREADTHVRTTNSSTTACVGFIHTTSEGVRYAVIANIGDSGALLVSASGHVEQITQDDSYLNDLLASRILSPEMLLRMKKDPTKRHNIPVYNDPHHVRMTPMTYHDISAYVIRTLGKGSAASLTIQELQPGDTLLLGTDGLIDKYETLPTANTRVDNVIRELMDFTPLSEPLQVDTPLPSQLDDIRTEASLRKAYKTTDDVAIVAARIKTE
jgi:serine/threonine protein phosphatase PrpC